METAAYEYLNLALGKKQALDLYYRLTGFIREHDPASFRKFMAYRDSTLKDDALMGFVLQLMLTRHRDMLAQLVPATRTIASA
ncbi:hypothetical protein DXT99_26730 [Pontibacter diazotrophicus]|uniref:Uncharacterized protein n=1 Tax=Pontibacter diazotrophicus TaxID=1400979 RepID=A0A3D8KYD9_9BACT|nr:hypothetical protein [Pontibacter diazotrophicus]RDV10238.1 hypothetical protein DXT99_26730 [Pontibacter diazotrophicus]